MKNNLFEKVRKQENLRNAWKKVYENGISSNSKETRNSVKDFSQDVEKNLRRISKDLLNNKFEFQPATGVPISRAGKSPRPLVIAPIRSRIVQRSILDIILKQKKLKNYVNHPKSFGGLVGKNVPEAIRVAHEAMKNGGTYFLRSDIEGFFTKIPRIEVLKKIRNLLSDSSIDELLEKATTVELENLAELSKQKDIFPTYEIGVAQGCCLSPLIGNILLRDFDDELNSEDIVCLRYIDDFLIIGPNPKAVHAAFKQGIKILKNKNLTAYHPSNSPNKAEEGITQKGFGFLGCDITHNLIRPNKAARKRLIDRIDKILKMGQILIRKENFDTTNSYKISLLATLQDTSNVLKGWSNHYCFCNSEALFNDMEKKIDKKIEHFLNTYSKKRGELNQRGCRRLLGVHLLTDGNKKPIIPKKYKIWK